MSDGATTTGNLGASIQTVYAGAGKKREDYEPPRPEWGQEPDHLFDPEPHKTGWTKEEGDARLNRIRAGLKQREARHYEASHNGLFRDRRS